jgi:uncharacterized protein YbjT (DUF2867 family)
MKVILFGATGMVGQGALRECLLDPQVEVVLSVARSRVGEQHPKLQEWVLPDLFDLAEGANRLQGFDAALFCLGVSSTGMSAADYRHVTYDLTIAIAQALVRLNPNITFIFVSGAGTDSTESGRTMWARVKGATENALLRMPFKAAYMFRPGAIRPLHGIRSKTVSYRIAYVLMAPVLPLLQRMLPGLITTTEQLGRAMLHAARSGAPKRVLETRDINQL